MSYKLFTLLYSVISVITLSDSYAQDFPALPEDVSFVNDMAGVLTIDQRDVLDIRLMEYYDSTRTIIMIVTINGFSGINPENYAAGLIVRWGVGNVYGEKALLMVVKPGNKSGPPFADIKPNQSMAGDIDRDLLQRIAEIEIMPLLKSGKYYSAVYRGTDALKSALAGTYQPAGKSRLSLPGNMNPVTIVLLLAAVILTGRIVVRVLQKSH